MLGTAASLVGSSPFVWNQPLASVLSTAGGSCSSPFCFGIGPQSPFLGFFSFFQSKVPQEVLVVTGWVWTGNNLQTELDLIQEPIGSKIGLGLIWAVLGVAGDLR